MANSKQAIKRVRQNKKQTLRNRMHRSRFRTEVKKLMKAVESKENSSNAAFKDIASLIDKTASKKIIHPNKAARLKSRLNRQLKKTAA